MGGFLTEFDGLTLSFSREGRPASAWFDAARATQYAHPMPVRDLAQRLGTTRAPVGYAYSDHLMLLAARDGAFYGSYDAFVSRLGCTPIEMVMTVVADAAEPLQTGELAATDADQLVDTFVAAAVAHGHARHAGDDDAAVAAATAVNAAASDLRAHPAAPAGALRPLVDYPDSSVQFWAARYLLPLEERLAKERLSVLARAGGLFAEPAAQVLDAYRRQKSA